MTIIIDKFEGYVHARAHMLCSQSLRFMNFSAFHYSL